MERIYPFDYRSFEIEIRELWFDVLVDELKQLHHAGFVHRNTQRRSNISGDRFANILLTSTGLRFIDVRLSAIKNVTGKIFAKQVETELQELENSGAILLAAD